MSEASSDQPEKGLQRSYKSMNLHMKNRNESTALARLIKQLDLEENYMRKHWDIQKRILATKYVHFIPMTEEEVEVENTELIFRSIREVNVKYVIYCGS